MERSSRRSAAKRNAPATTSRSRRQREDSDEQAPPTKQPRSSGRTTRKSSKEMSDNEQSDKVDEDRSKPSTPQRQTRSSRRDRSSSINSNTSSSASDHRKPPADDQDDQDNGNEEEEEKEEETSQSSEEKLQELEQKKRMLEEGTLSEYCRRVAEFKENRDRLLALAERHKSLQVRNIQDLHDFSVQRAHHLYQDGKEEVKKEMMQRFDVLLDKCTKEIQALDKSAEASKATSKDESKASEELKDGHTDESNGTDGEAPTSPELPEESVRLQVNDVTSDLASILQTREECAKDATSSVPKPTLEPVRCDHKRLVCGKYIYEYGDEVVLSSPLLQESYVGCVSSVASDALYIHLSSGQKVRIYLDLLRTRRCVLTPFLRGAASTGNLQANGWAF